MKTDYVSLETAKLLKEIGYDWECEKFYNAKTLHLDEGIEYSDCDCGNGNTSYVTKNWNDGIGSYPTLQEEIICSAPLLYYAAKWLREVHKIHIEIGLENYTDGYIWGYQLLNIGNDHSVNKYDGEYKTYEFAVDIAIQEACKIIKNK